MTSPARPRVRMPIWLTVFFLFWPAALLLLFVSVDTSSRAAKLAAEREIARLAETEEALRVCPELGEYMRSELVLEHDRCTFGNFELVFSRRGDERSRLYAYLRGPFQSCILPIVWTSGMVALARLESSGDQPLRTCYLETEEGG